MQVPCGTIVRGEEDEEHGTALAELLTHGQRALLAQGGRGGRGNASFKTGKNTCAHLSISKCSSCVSSCMGILSSYVRDQQRRAAKVAAATPP